MHKGTCLIPTKQTSIFVYLTISVDSGVHLCLPSYTWVPFRRIIIVIETILLKLLFVVFLNVSANEMSTIITLITSSYRLIAYE